MSSRKQYDRELKNLSSRLVQMAVKSVEAVEHAMTAVKTYDKALAKAVIHGDDEINTLEREIEQRCLKLLLMQQPVASDLRQVGATMKMITDIERIGDEAVDIAELALHHEACAIPQLREDVIGMAATACEMVDAAVTSYITDDLSLAGSTKRRDDDVDERFVRLRGELGQHLLTHPQDIDEVVDYLMMIKYLERVADHAVNLCEWVEFKLTGQHKDAAMF
ncbi:MAG: phosphate signaling complex protein PhoU [Candidatus Onthomonas sp.]